MRRLNIFSILKAKFKQKFLKKIANKEIEHRIPVNFNNVITSFYKYYKKK